MAGKFGPVVHARIHGWAIAFDDEAIEDCDDVVGVDRAVNFDRQGPNRKRSAVTMLRERFRVSERRACGVIGIHRSTQRLAPPPVTDDEAELRASTSVLHAATAVGWRCAAKEASRQGREVNDQRARRIIDGWPTASDLLVAHQRIAALC